MRKWGSALTKRTECFRFGWFSLIQSQGSVVGWGLSVYLWEVGFLGLCQFPPPPPVNNTSYAGCAPYVYTTYNEVNQHPIDSRWPTLPRAWRKDLDMRMLNHVFGEGPTCFHNQRSLSRVLKSAVLSCDWIWLDVIDKFGIHQMGYHNNTFGLNSQTVKF